MVIKSLPTKKCSDPDGFTAFKELILLLFILAHKNGKVRNCSKFILKRCYHLDTKTKKETISQFS
jgi:hypothetical protein